MVEHHMGWSAAGFWFCVLMALGCFWIGWPRRKKRNRRINDSAWRRTDDRDSLQRFANENGSRHVRVQRDCKRWSALP